MKLDFAVKSGYGLGAWQAPKRPEDRMKPPFLVRRLVEQRLTQWLSGKKINKNLSAIQAT